jgi:hypothetical protein
LERDVLERWGGLEREILKKEGVKEALSSAKSLFQTCDKYIKYLLLLILW